MKLLYTLFTFIAFTFSAKAQWTTNTSTNLELAGVNSADIISGATTDGGTFIAFYSQNGANYDMRVQYINAQGVKQFGADGMVVSNFPTGSATFVFNAMVDKNNNFLVSFNDQRMGSNGTAIVKVTQAGTLPWGMGGIYLGAGLSPYAAVLSDDEVVVAWNNNNNRISYQKITTTGTAAWSPAKELFPITSGRAISRVQVVAHTAGKFGFVFQQRNGTVGSPTPTTLYEQQFDIDGNALWASPVALSNYVTANSTYYSVLSYGDITYVGYYANPSLQNRFDAFLQRVNGNGTLPWGINGSDFATDPTPYEMVTNIAYTPGAGEVWAVSSFTNSLQSLYGVYVQKFSATTGARFLTDNAKTIVAINANREQQRGNLTLCSGTDPIFMFYDVNYKIYATKLDASGNFSWTPNIVEISSTTNSKLRFNFNNAVNSQAVAVWQENRGVQDRAYAQNISCGGAAGPTPVTLIGFRGNKNGKNVDLYWTTINENNNAGFYGERSSDGISFSSVAFVSTKANGGNSSTTLNYSISDVQPAKGYNYYRLKQMDKDGKFVYTNVIKIKFDENENFILQALYPNPATNEIAVKITSEIAENISLLITDMAGKTIYTNAGKIFPGDNKQTINISKLAAGKYLLKVIDSKNGTTQLQSFYKMK